MTAVPLIDHAEERLRTISRSADQLARSLWRILEVGGSLDDRDIDNLAVAFELIRDFAVTPTVQPDCLRVGFQALRRVK